MDETQRQGEGEEVGKRDLRDSPLPEGSIILGGRYRLVRLLHRRPRVNLYLAKRLSPSRECIQHDEERGPLVAIRELVLTGFTHRERMQVEQAAFEEFVSPIVLGSPRLPGAGDRVRSEGDRHYLVMQLRGTRGQRDAVAVTLADLLLSQKRWPAWLGMEMALSWGLQLSRIIARLHRLGVVLGDLNPATVLVDAEGAAAWAPVLLVSWPPPPQFWSFSSDSTLVNAEDYYQKFPVPRLIGESAFAAPEMFNGRYDERSDVYSLGALLYLLFTHYAPTAVARRQTAALGEGGGPGGMSAPLPMPASPGTEALELVSPHHLNSQLPLILEYVLLRALALNPAERYPTVFAMVEDLETVDRNYAEAEKNVARYASKVEKVLGWLKRELTT